MCSYVLGVDAGNSKTIALVARKRLQEICGIRLILIIERIEFFVLFVLVIRLARFGSKAARPRRSEPRAAEIPDARKGSR